MAYMAFSGHDSEQPVNPSDVHLVINSVPAFIHTAMPDGYLDLQRNFADIYGTVLGGCAGLEMDILDSS